MDQPYVLAKVHKAASAADFHVYTAPTKTGSAKYSSRELVAAIDSQGLNIYNLATSYSLSPSTKFHCSPVSIVNRLSSTRHTYAALQTGSDQMRVQCWVETNSESETQALTYDLKTKVQGLYHLGHSILLVYISGDIERVALDLSMSLETIRADSYLDTSSQNILLHSVEAAQDDSDDFVLRIVSSGESLKMNLLKCSDSVDENKRETALKQTVIPYTKGVKELLAQHIAIGEGGQLAICVTGSKHFEILLFNDSQDEFGTMRIPRPKHNGKPLISMRWLNTTHLAFSHGNEASIWDTTYRTCQSTISLEEAAAMTALVPLKSLQRPKSVSYLVLCSATSILLSQITFGKESSLLEAIGKNPKHIKLSDSWLQDIDMQSTWKDSLSVVLEPALTCLDALSKVQSGEEFDAVMEDFLFPGSDTAQVRTKVNRKALRSDASNSTSGSKSKRQAKHRKQQKSLDQQPSAPLGEGSESSPLAPATNGYHKVDQDVVMANGLSSPAASVRSVDSDEEDAELESALSKEVANRHYSARQSFDSYSTEVALSSTFVNQLLKLIFLDLPAKSENGTTPMATIDFLLKKSLLSFSGTAESGLLATIIKSRPDLRLRLVNEVVGLLPDQLLDILLTFLDDQVNLRPAIAAVVRKLDLFDETMVTLAIRSKVASTETCAILEALGEELQTRLSDAEHENKIAVSDETLCAAITRFLDSVGVANLVFSSIPDTLLLSLRVAVNHLIARNGEVASTAGYISELLMKARLLDTNKARLEPKSDTIIESNPEPQPKKVSLALDQVKKTDKNQTKRAKAYARVQGIGSVYTIETLQI